MDSPTFEVGNLRCVHEYVYIETFIDFMSIPYYSGRNYVYTMELGGGWGPY